MSAASNRRLRLAYLVVSYLALFMTLTHAGIGRQGGSADYLFGSALAVLITMTCAYDASVLGRPWAIGVRLPFLIVWPVAMPLYLIRSRGWRGCLMLLIHVIVLAGIVVAVAIMAGLAQIFSR